MLIVSITKFLIVIGSLGAYLSRNRRVITWVSNYRFPIWTFSNWIPVLGYPHDFNVIYVHFDGFLPNVFYSFENLGEALQTFSLKRSSWTTFSIEGLCAKKAYIEFWPIFIFCRIKMKIGQNSIYALFARSPSILKFVIHVDMIN